MLKRQEAENWKRKVPGARWFKSDLHIHTIDDLPGDRVKMPSGISKDPQSPEAISAYARCFLQSAIARGVQVLGITPHSPALGTGGVTSSAVWQIVEEWNNGNDDNGIPFREKVYAVFPGFEPSFKDGKSGLHMLFLFDPEMGFEKYLKAFNQVMGGVSPWPEKPENQLRMSSNTAEEAFNHLREFHKRECPRTEDGTPQWSYIVLAPHIDGDKGLLGAQKAQVLQLFQHDEVAGLELGDEKLPDDTLKDRPWLRDGMTEHHQSFFHSTDAYSLEDIGNRHTWLKIASPRIEALRQAFIASDSRIRIGFERNPDGGLVPIERPPDVTMNDRPWLKSVTVSGRASFFGAGGDDEAGTSFYLSPDLTCVIGGSMTGKSTFLDGLRVHIGAALPQDENVKKQVETRGKDRFLTGSARVVLDCPGRDTTATPREQWPAVFYAQSELQRLAASPDTAEDVLSLLVASETQGIKDRDARLTTCDRELAKDVNQLAEMAEKLGEAEQAFSRSKNAAAELAAFSDAGVEDLNRVASDLRQWQEYGKAARDFERDIEKLIETGGQVELLEAKEYFANALGAAGVVGSETELRTNWNRAMESLRSAKEEASAANAVSQSMTNVLEAYEKEARVRLDRRLAELGLDGARINQLQALNSQASLVGSYEANLNQTRVAIQDSEHSFNASLKERDNIISEQRHAFDRVIETIYSQFDGRITARRINYGHKNLLDSFLRGLGQRGITRWWNDLDHDNRPTPDVLLAKIDAHLLGEVGMSETVQETFLVQLTPTKRRELAAIRCRDQYVLEFRMDDGRYRLLDDLSGGQRVNLLLSLLLETNDESPLVIDQPEDELDNRFLFETLLPVLKRLKGRRQIILATHNANIVVNGDADQVIHLEATANRGRVASSGAIEEPAIRDAIVRTVDGGEEAFRMRRLKYGF